MLYALPHDGLMKTLLTSTAYIAGPVAAAFAIFGSFWLAWPLSTSLESEDCYKAEAALELYRRRRAQVSMMAALLIYYAAGLGMTVASHGWSASESYLRDHILDGFGCAAFFAVGWSQMERHANRGTGLLSAATAGIAAAAAFQAHGTSGDVALLAGLGWVYGLFIWGYITGKVRATEPLVRQLASEAPARRIRDAVTALLPQLPSPDNHAGTNSSTAEIDP
jgi:hypothetical protein